MIANIIDMLLKRILVKYFSEMTYVLQIRIFISYILESKSYN